LSDPQKYDLGCSAGYIRDVPFGFLHAMPYCEGLEILLRVMLVFQAAGYLRELASIYAHTKHDDLMAPYGI